MKTTNQKENKIVLYKDKNVPLFESYEEVQLLLNENELTFLIQTIKNHLLMFYNSKIDEDELYKLLEEILDKDVDQFIKFYLNHEKDSETFLPYAIKLLLLGLS
jgi:hypothetical protein